MSPTIESAIEFGAIAERPGDEVVPIDDFMKDLHAEKIPRVPGTAVFLFREYSFPVQGILTRAGVTAGM